MRARTAFLRLFGLLAAVALALPARAARLTFAVDCPTALSAVNYLPNQTVLYTGSAYAAGLTLNPAISIDALDVLPSGQLLFSADAPFTVGAVTYQPGDVVQCDPATAAYSMYLQGSTLGLPAGANIDALARTPGGNLVISLDAPWNAGAGTTYMPYDLLEVAPGPSVSLYFSGSAAGLKKGMDVRGAEIASADLLWFCLETPVVIGATTYLPGDVIQASNSAGWTLSLYWRPPSFPAGSALADFYFESPGRVPDGYFVPGTNLTVVKSITGGPNDLDLAWGATCLPGGATDYAIYEGTIGTWYSHDTRAACTTGGTLAATITPSPDSRYYLVVPLNGVLEGSYGTDSTGTAQRPRSASPCVAAQKVTPCP